MHDHPVKIDGKGLSSREGSNPLPRECHSGEATQTHAQSRSNRSLSLPRGKPASKEGRKASACVLAAADKNWTPHRPPPYYPQYDMRFSHQAIDAKNRLQDRLLAKCLRRDTRL